MNRTANAFGVPALLLGAALSLVLASKTAAASQPCGTATYPFPYTDVASVADPFCPGIMEAYVTGISKGTTPTTFSPNNSVTRVQMTTFLQRAVDQVLTRASRRAALNQWWTPQTTNAMQMIALGQVPAYCAADGENIWVSASIGLVGEVVQVQASTGKVLGTWTGATYSQGVVVAGGKIYVVGAPSRLLVIDPTQPPGAVTVAASNLGGGGGVAQGIAFDGTHLWTANAGPPGSVSIITPQATTPYPVTTVSTGFSSPEGIVYDGVYIWVTDNSAGTLLKLDSAGAILQTVAVGNGPRIPVFDGANIWVPNTLSNSLTVVQASTGNVVATINADSSNQLNSPTTASFDGERVLVTNFESVTVFKAADLSVITNVTTGGASTFAACSDGINFWITLYSAEALARF
jgi:hypothetical protein